MVGPGPRVLLTPPLVIRVLHSVTIIFIFNVVLPYNGIYRSVQSTAYSTLLLAYRRLCLLMFCNKDMFSRWGVVSPSPNPQAEGPPVHRAYSIYLQRPSIVESVPPSATWEHTVPWWQGPTYDMDFLDSKIQFFTLQTFLNWDFIWHLVVSKNRCLRASMSL
jgi:hypothetical protein